MQRAFACNRILFEHNPLADTGAIIGNRLDRNVRRWSNACRHCIGRFFSLCFAAGRFLYDRQNLGGRRRFYRWRNLDSFFGAAFRRRFGLFFRLLRQ